MVFDRTLWRRLIHVALNRIKLVSFCLYLGP